MIGAMKIVLRYFNVASKPFLLELQEESDNHRDGERIITGRQQNQRDGSHTEHVHVEYQRGGTRHK